MNQEKEMCESNSWPKADIFYEKIYYMKTHTGKTYSKVWCEDGKLKLTLENYSKDFVIVMDAKVIPQLIDILLEIQGGPNYRVAYDEWIKKTNWVQENVKAKELGLHRADVIKDRMDKLIYLNQQLVYALNYVSDFAGYYLDNDCNYIIDSALNKAREM